MAQHAAECTTVEQAARARRGNELIVEVFRRHAREYSKRHKVTFEQANVIRDILSCRTGECGETIWRCPACGYQEIQPSSCGNRHCPTCHGSKQAAWVEKQQARILPVGHFFVTFTVPEELRWIALQNAKAMYGLMFRSVSWTLKRLARDHLGAKLGVLSVLHTWTRELNYHPHVHCAVTAGGLSEDGRSWKATRPNFLFPFAEMKALYRKRMVQGLHGLYEQGKLELYGRQEMLAEAWAFGRLVKKLWKKQWVVDVQSPRGDPEHAVKYLGAYVHRVAISGARMVSVGEGRVSFKTRGDKTLTLEAEEFIRRFLLHVLPSGLHKTRPYGLYSRSGKEDLKTARELIGAVDADTKGEGNSPCEAECGEEVVTEPKGRVARDCPECGLRGMTKICVPRQAVIYCTPRDTS